MDKEEFYKIAKIIEIEIQSGKNYSQCIGMGYFTERFNDAWEQVKKLNKPAVSNNEVAVCENCRFNKPKNYYDYMWCRDCQQKNHFEQTDC